MPHGCKRQQLFEALCLTLLAEKVHRVLDIIDPGCNRNVQRSQSAMLHVPALNTDEWRLIESRNPLANFLKPLTNLGRCRPLEPNA